MRSFQTAVTLIGLSALNVALAATDRGKGNEVKPFVFVEGHFNKDEKRLIYLRKKLDEKTVEMQKSMLCTVPDTILKQIKEYKQWKKCRKMFLLRSDYWKGIFNGSEEVSNEELAKRIYVFHYCLEESNLKLYCEMSGIASKVLAQSDDRTLQTHFIEKLRSGLFKFEFTPLSDKFSEGERKLIRLHTKLRKMIKQEGVDNKDVLKGKQIYEDWRLTRDSFLNNLKYLEPLYDNDAEDPILDEEFARRTFILKHCYIRPRKWKPYTKLADEACLKLGKMIEDQSYFVEKLAKTKELKKGFLAWKRKLARAGTSTGTGTDKRL